MRVYTTFGLFLLSVTCSIANACDCSGASTVWEALYKADIVAIGKVISIKPAWLPDSAKAEEMVMLGFNADSFDKKINPYYSLKVLVKIDSTYKGNTIGDTLTIYTGMTSDVCGFAFKVGEKYIIYGNQKPACGPGIFWTSSCTRTKEYNQREIQELENITR